MQLTLVRYVVAGVLLAGSLGANLPCIAQTNVATWHNDVARTGQNLNEALLTPARVKVQTFGLLATVAVDGRVDAQPLYQSALSIDGGTHNILFIATAHGSVYAADADSGVIYWKRSLLGVGETPSDDRSCNQVSPEIGIVSTPVIDRSAGLHGSIFLVAMSKDAAGNYHQRIHSLDLLSGAEQHDSPVLVQATFPGSGDGSAGGTVTFDPVQYVNRPALLLAKGNLYIAWGSHCDFRPYSGWMLAYHETNLQQVSVLNVAPNGSEAAFWNAGSGPAADSNGNIFASTGNGTFDTVLNGQGLPSHGDYGNSLLKLNGATLAPLDYWTMYNSNAESANGVDFGSGGVMLLPDQSDAAGKVWHLAIAAGKDSNLYVANRDNLGHYDAANDGTLYQQVTAALPGGVWSSPAYFNGRVYYAAVGDYLRSFPVVSAQLTTRGGLTTTNRFGYPGATPSVSALGSANAIVWATENTNPAVLHAYDAVSLAELYNSNQAAGSRDHFGAGNKFILPTIANGKVYVGTTSSVAIFGFIRQTPPPLADGDYVLLNDASRLVLDDPESSTASGIALYQWAPNGGANQHWFLSYNGNGFYTIQNTSSSLFATDPGGAKTSGISLVQAQALGNVSQLWSLRAVGTSYVITNKATGLAFDDREGTLAEGPHVILWPPDGGLNQSWTFE